MNDGEVLVSGGEASDSGENILDGLPPWMPKDESSGNFKLLDVVGRSFDRLNEDLLSVDKATNVQTAESIEQLEELGKLVDTQSKLDESIEKYRSRLFGEFQNTTNEGDLPGLFENVSLLLDIQKSKIGYQDGTEGGAFILSVPGNSIEGVGITQSEFSEIINGQVAAGFRPDIQTRGTFTYLTPNQYDNNDYDVRFGYDGLDSNGDVKDNGGTYAGVLN